MKAVILWNHMVVEQENNGFVPYLILQVRSSREAVADLLKKNINVLDVSLKSVTSSAGSDKSVQQPVPESVGTPPIPVPKPEYKDLEKEREKEEKVEELKSMAAQANLARKKKK